MRWRARLIRPGLAAALLFTGQGVVSAQASAPPAFPAARTLVPFVKDAEVDCHWMMHGAGEKWIRGSIGQGDEDPVLSLVDSAFGSWSDSEDHRIQVSAGDAGHRLPASAWAGNAGGQAPGGIGFYLDASLRQLVGGATSLQIWKNGKPVFNMLLAATPTRGELDGCVRPPSQDNGDSE